VKAWKKACLVVENGLETGVFRLEIVVIIVIIIIVYGYTDTFFRIQARKRGILRVSEGIFNAWRGGKRGLALVFAFLEVNHQSNTNHS
jgi:hypothetical protein